MLCPGCTSHGIPQIKRVAEIFNNFDVSVVGLHTVFEHHTAQGSPEALKAFLHEYRITFPVGIDMQSANGLPKTMAAYDMQGTPTLILFDRAGRRQKQIFGVIDDIALGAEIAFLLNEATKK